MLGQGKVDTVVRMLKSKHCKKSKYCNLKIKSFPGRGQLWNEQTTPSQPKLKPGFRLSRHCLSLEKSWPWLLIGPVCTVYCSDLHCLLVRSWLLIGPISGTLFRWGHSEPAEWVVYRYHVGIFGRQYAQFLQTALKIVVLSVKKSWLLLLIFTGFIVLWTYL